MEVEIEKVRTKPYSLSSYAFLTNSDFNAIDPKPSILQSILWSPSVNRIPLTLVPALIGLGAPFTGRFLIIITESPLCSSVPLETSTFKPASSNTSSLGFHSWLHSGHAYRLSPNEYP